MIKKPDLPVNTVKSTESTGVIINGRHYHDVNDFPECVQWINLAFTRKHHTLNFNEFQSLKNTYVQKHYGGVMGFNSRLGVSNEATEALKGILHKLGIVILPKEADAPLHQFKLIGDGLNRLNALERKLNLSNKLAKNQASE